MKKIFLVPGLFFLFVFVYFLFGNRKSSTADASAKLNLPLIKELDSILNLDQKYRLQFDSVRARFGERSTEYQELCKMCFKTDSSNLIRIKEIINTYGWLGTSVIGPNGNQVLFLVIQHADQKTQEYYLPIMQKAVRAGDANAYDLALLEDRVLIGQGKRQIYGSQVSRDAETNSYYVLPLNDPDNVDNRRHSVGLQSLSEYLVSFKIKWDAEQYKKDLPQLELREKENRKRFLNN